MKKRLLLLLSLFTFCFVNAQLATFSAPSSYGITATSATISFTVTSSSTTTLYSQLATGSAGNVTLSPLSGAGGSAAGTWVSPKNLTGLTPNTTYYFRYRCDNASGTSYSTTGSFTTLSGAPTISFTNSPSSYNTVTINYSLNANGLATTSLIRYGLTSGNLSSQVTGSSSSGASAIAAFANISGLLSNTTYYFQIEATNSVGTTTSSILSFTTQSQAPGIFSVTTSSITTNSASINYSLWDKGLATTSIVRYGLASGNLTNQVTGFSVSGDVTVPGSASLTGLNPSTTYYYQVEATNSAGISTSTIASFTTLNVPTIIANYPFNNSRNNSQGNSPFSTLDTTFALDRNNQSMAALRTSGISSATINNLPVGNSSRSISFWFRKGALTGDIQLFKYGTNGNSQIFGSYITTNGNYYFQGFANDRNFGGNAPNDVWTHLVITYNSTDVKMFVNGTQLGTSQSINLNTGSSTFTLGHPGTVIAFDDLNIYNYELSQSDITSLFNNNTLSSSDFNQNNLEVSLYPNPAIDILNIETDLELKSIEIYNIQGQKVMSSNQKQVNVSDLSTGIYMVRIEDADNAIATKKFVKK